LEVRPWGGHEGGALLSGMSGMGALVRRDKMLAFPPVKIQGEGGHSHTRKQTLPSTTSPGTSIWISQPPEA